MLKDISVFEAQLTSFKNKIDNHESAEKIANSFYSLSKKFKNIEPFLLYYDADRYEYFNGAPVMRLDKQIPGYHLSSPEGLQVIELMITDDSMSFTKISELCKSLAYQTQLWTSYVQDLSISTFEVLKILYLQTIYIETMGLAGFDKIDKTKVATEQLQSVKVIFYYLSIIQKENLFSKAQNKELLHIKNILNSELCSSFTTIDRLKITKSGLQPLRKIITSILPENCKPYYSPINFHSYSLYDSLFLNPLFYAAKGYYNQFSGEKPSRELIHLGKQLFSDSILSSTSTLSCSSCHQPEKYFTDGLPKSISNAESVFLDRNTPTVLYTGYQSALLYDMSAASLEDQLSHVIVNKKEFNTSYTILLQNIAKKPKYVTQFSSLFPEYGTNAIQIFTINKALAAYVRSLASFNSEFDRYMRQETSISDEAYKGYNLFMGKAGCGTCHFPPHFGGLRPPHYLETESENIGALTKFDTLHPSIDNDNGVYNFTKNIYFKGQFKVSSLRNIMQTAPYMHNGAFATLDEVITFYNKGGAQGMGLNNPQQTLPDDALHLSDDETHAIIAFLHTLNDIKR
jgi:cytochrome c peroxidase